MEQAFNFPLLLSLKNENFTVFRASLEDVEDKNIPLSINKGLLLKSFSHCQSVPLNFLDTLQTGQTNSPHKPLMLTGISRSDIVGSIGLRLAQEYNKPWVATIDKIKRQQSGGVNVQSFQAKNLIFERVERYNVGKVNNFESLLLNMFEKYKLSFEETANLAERMYLNT